MTSNALQTAMIPPRKGKRGSLTDLAQTVVRKTKLELYVAYPCTVRSFDETTQTVEVVVDFSHVLANDESEDTLPAEVIPNIGVKFEGEGKSGGGYLTFPVEPGDKGYVVVFDRSIDRWREKGEGGDPILRRTHNRIDGVFRPGLRDLSRVLSNFDATAAVLEHTCIKLGANATEAAVLGDTLKTFMDAFQSWASGHTHLVTGVTSGMSATTSNPPTNPPPTVPDFLSAKVKIDAGSVPD